MTHYPRERTGCPFDPPPEYAQWREEAPVKRVTLPGGRNPWLVTRYEDVRRLLRDPRLSSDSTRPGYPAFGAAVEVPPLNRTFIGVDEPAHTRLRQMVAGEFTTAAVNGLRPEITRIVDACIDRMAAHDRPADLVAEFALPVSSMVICRVLGVPYSAHDVFERNTRVLTDGASPDEEKARAGAELLGLLAELVKERAARPQDDLTSRLVTGHVATGELTAEDAVLNLGLLLGAGYETSANMIALSVLLLARDQTLQHRLRADPELVRHAVEELLRYLTIVQLGLARVAVADLEIDGHPVKAGEGVVLSLQGANRDARRFADPDVLDVDRHNAARHVAFGFGPHQCLGHLLARVELEIALSRLLQRLPPIRLAVPEVELAFKNTMDFYGLHRLPVTWPHHSPPPAPELVAEKGMP